MKIHWIAVAALSAGFAAGCGEKTPENEQNASQNDGTTVTVPQETGAQANREPAPAQPAAASTSRDSSTRPSNSVAGSTSRPTNSAAARDESRPAVRIVTTPAGTALPLELTTAVSSATAQVEMPVSAKLRRAVVVNGETVLPAGAVVNGEVSDVDRAGRVKGRSRLALRFTSVVVAGRRASLRTNPVSFEGEATKSEDATKIGAGAGIGAAIGGLIGGGSGAAKGAVIGGAAGTGAVVATRGKEVELAAGADLNPTLASPVEVEVR